jgi:3'(2'), 5'-bisphosphate nucleotidase
MDNILTRLSSFILVADFGAQAIVNSIIHKHFPNDPIVGEEDSKDLQEDSVMRQKVLDLVNGVAESPLDADQVRIDMFEGRDKRSSY